jgi:DnaA family protein
VVCVDDIEEWAGDVDKERALFTLFEQIKHAGGQLIVSATQPPNSSDFVIKDLVSRLSSGLIYPLHELNDEHRFEALKMRAKVRGLSISDDAVRYLQSRSSRDTGELFEVLDRIDHASLVEQRRVTIPFLQNLLKREE